MVPIIIIAVALLAVVLMLLFSDQAQKRRADKSEWKDDHFAFASLCELVRVHIENYLNEDILELNLNRRETESRQTMQLEIENATRWSCQGDVGKRNYLKDFIKGVLVNELGVDEVSINKAIDFEKPINMSPVEKFEYLYTIYQKHNRFDIMRLMMNDFHWDDPKPTGDGRTTVRYIDKYDIDRAFLNCKYKTKGKDTYDSQLDTLVQRVFEKLYGNDVVDLLILDESLDGVSGGSGGKTKITNDYIKNLEKTLTENAGDEPANQYDTVYCMYHGMNIRLKFLSFGSVNTLASVTKKVGSYDVQHTLSKKQPVLVGTTRNNARVVSVRPPHGMGWSFWIRKFESGESRHVESLVTHYGRGIVIALLRTITQGMLNFVVSGDQGSGKTTLLKSLVNYFNPNYTIRTAEGSFELGLQNLYPGRNVYSMQERGDQTVYDILTSTKKMDTDIVIVGEVNEPKIAGAFVQVAQSGSRMAATTLHHTSTEALIEYLRNALVSEFRISNVDIAEKQIVDILNFDVHTEKDLSGHFYIKRITEIVPATNTPYPKNTSEAQLEYYKRSTDRHYYELHDIIVFDHENMCYRVQNNISDYTFNLIARKAGLDLANSIREMLAIAAKDSTVYDTAFMSSDESLAIDIGSGSADVYEEDEYADEYADAGVNDVSQEQTSDEYEPMRNDEDSLFELNNGFGNSNSDGINL